MMAEKHIVRLYKKMKSRLISSIRKDALFEEFYRVFASGKRTYSVHNSALKKSVDEAWVHAVEACIPHLERVVASPRKAIKQEEDVVPVELAKKVTAASVKHLASNSQYVAKFENGSVTPNKILNAYNEETLDIYENRFVATLLTRVSQFIDRRYYLLGEHGGDEATSKLTLSGNFDQNGEETDYALSLNVHQGARYLGGRGVAAEIFERLDTVRGYINSYKSSPFMKRMAGTAPVRPPVMNTNLLAKDPDYRACVTLWNFMDRYDKVGYQIDVTETDPPLSPESCAELDALVLFQYLVLKNRLYELEGEAQDAPVPRRRTVKPRFKRVREPLDGLYDIEQREVLKVNLDGSNRREVDARLRQAVSQALQIEKQKKRTEDAALKRERVQEERRVGAAIRNALAAERSRRRVQAKEKRQDDRELAATLSGVLAAERKKKKLAEKNRQREAREREIAAALARTLALSEKRKDVLERKAEPDGETRAALKKRIARDVTRLVEDLEENDSLIARRSEAAMAAPDPEVETPESGYLFGGYDEEPAEPEENAEAEAAGQPEEDAPALSGADDDVFEIAPDYAPADVAATFAEPEAEEPQEDGEELFEEALLVEEFDLEPEPAAGQDTALEQEGAGQEAREPAFATGQEAREPAFATGQEAREPEAEEPDTAARASEAETPPPRTKKRRRSFFRWLFGRRDQR